jgi:anti-sigma regulatory factor (Ser/Thr protein kinase)
VSEHPTAESGPPERTVGLEIPAEFRFVSMARVAAAGLAAELDPAIDDLEDLRVAVNELVGILVEAAKGGTILIRMWIEERTIHVSGRCLGEWAPTEPDQLAQRILDATVDHHEIGDGAFRMLTHLSAE